MKILVTGGGGYIGSHMVRLLGEAGHSIVVFDDFSTGFRDAVLFGEITQGNLLNKAELDQCFAQHGFDVVIHFAGLIAVGESVVHPARYYETNLVGSLNLLQSMLRHDVRKIVFSSTAAIFGVPEYSPIDERHPKQPINPYGRSKWIIEQVLRDYSSAYGLKSISLRYFNAAGASPDGLLGERHHPETHLIPLALRATQLGQERLRIFGNDYATPDGTCIRDFVHVMDLCQAHLLAIEHLNAGGESRQYNLGSGCGYSVLEVIRMIKRVTGSQVAFDFVPRRPGDPERLVANAAKIKQDWGWMPRYGLQEIVEHAWQWEQKTRGSFLR